jgi:hypothetical protein
VEWYYSGQTDYDNSVMNREVGTWVKRPCSPEVATKFGFVSVCKEQQRQYMQNAQVQKITLL